MPVEKQIEIGNVRINYIDEGQGTPIIFLHNGGGFWQSWSHQISYFSDKYRTIAIDWPGFGESGPAHEMISLELLTRTLSDFIKKLMLNDVILVGNCIGGSAALNYAQRNNANVRVLILFNICPGNLILPPILLRQLIPFVNHVPFIKRVLVALFSYILTKTPVKNKFPSILFGRRKIKDDILFKLYERKFRQPAQTSSRINLLFSVHTYTLKSFMTPERNIKTFLMWGEENEVTPYKTHGKIHQTLLKPDLFELIPDGGHLCMYEKPDIVNRHISDYIHMINR